MNNKKSTLNFLRILLISIFVLLIIYFFFRILSNSKSNSISSKIPPKKISKSSKQTYSSNKTDFWSECDINVSDFFEDGKAFDVRKIFGGSSINLCYLGLDTSLRRKKLKLGARTDAIIVIHIDFNSKEIVLLSVPRDTISNVPGTNEYLKINEVFDRTSGNYKEKLDNSITAIRNLLGTIDLKYYIATDMNVVKEIIDVVGGIEVDVDVPVTIAKRHLNRGKQKLSGQQTLDLARWRSSGKGCLDRINRQQNILISILNKSNSMSLLKMVSLVMKIKEFDGIYTNLSDKDISALISFVLDIENKKIKTYVLPIYTLFRGRGYYFGFSVNETAKLISSIFGKKYSKNFRKKFGRISFAKLGFTKTSKYFDDRTMQDIPMFY